GGWRPGSTRCRCATRPALDRRRLLRGGGGRASAGPRAAPALREAAAGRGRTLRRGLQPHGAEFSAAEAAAFADSGGEAGWFRVAGARDLRRGRGVLLLFAPAELPLRLPLLLSAGHVPFGALRALRELRELLRCDRREAGGGAGEADDLLL